MFYEYYSHGLVQANTSDNTMGYRFPSVEVWKQLGRTGAAGEGIAAAGAMGGASFAPQVDYSTGIERYNVSVSPLVWTARTKVPAVAHTRVPESTCCPIRHAVASYR